MTNEDQIARVKVTQSELTELLVKWKTAGDDVMAIAGTLLANGIFLAMTEVPRESIVVEAISLASGSPSEVVTASVVAVASDAFVSKYNARKAAIEAAKQTIKVDLCDTPGCGICSEASSG